jgi:hypothetical protein
MSTKTTFKRVALATVAAMGFGLLSVAPANAVVDEVPVTSVSVGTAAAMRIGVAGNIPVTFKFAAGQEGETFTVGARITSAPTGSKLFDAAAGSAALADYLNVVDVAGDATTNDVVSSGTTETVNSSGTSDISTDALVTLNATDAGTSASVKFSFIPDKVGSYTILFWAGGTTWSAAYKSANKTVATVGAPTSITMTKIGSVIPSTGANGALVAITLKDAAGNATRLGLNEALSVADNNTNTEIQEIATGTVISALGSAAAAGVGSDNVSAGTYFVRVVASAVGTAATVVLTVTGTGSALPATLTTNTSLSYVVTSADTAITAFDLSADAVGYDAGYTTATSASHVFTASVAAASTTKRVYPVQVVNTLGLTYDTTVTIAAAASATATTPVTGDVTVAAALAAGDSITVTANAIAVTVSYAVAIPDALSNLGQSYLVSALGSTTTWAIKVADQYGSAIANQAVSVSVAGRNTVATKVVGVSDANGVVTYSHKDSAAATSTSTSDVLTFTSGALTPLEATIVYGTVTVGTVTVTGGSTAETVAGSITSPISTGDGAEGGAVPFTATVKDADGNLLAGVAVTFTIDAGATGAVEVTKTVNYTTVYTGAAGTAVTRVFGWKAPQKITVTATAGGKSGTGYVNFVNDDLDARVLSVIAVGNVATALVVDRFGNPVEGVTVNGSASNGYFGSGTTSTSGMTAANGTVGFVYAGSDNATLTFKIDKTVYTQSADAAGEVGGEALTAAVAGTTVGTGASLAPAGVNTVTVAVTPKDVAAENAQAATDAAAEATDAANAATDAANAAAEAADAATAAAQDAADAVAALSTQVSEMINALKKQITALTNLVIKIQKKVKA